MPLAIKCPHCNERSVEIAKKTWYLNGLIFFAQYGSVTHVGCKSCVNRQVRSRLLKSALGGWWCMPWGLGTPLVIVQNLAALFNNRTNNKTLDQVFEQAGIERDEIEFDESGLTREQRKLLDVAYAIAAKIMRADGEINAAKIQHVLSCFRQVIEGPMDETQILKGLERGEKLTIQSDGLSFQARSILLGLAVDIAMFQGDVAEHARQLLVEIADQLTIHREQIDTFILSKKLGPGNRFE